MTIKSFQLFPSIYKVWIKTNSLCSSLIVISPTNEVSRAIVIGRGRTYVYVYISRFFTFSFRLWEVFADIWHELWLPLPCQEGNSLIDYCKIEQLILWFFSNMCPCDKQNFSLFECSAILNRFERYSDSFSFVLQFLNIVLPNLCLCVCTGPYNWFQNIVYCGL